MNLLSTPSFKNDFLVSITLGAICLATSAYCVEAITLKTPRGAEVHATIHMPAGENLPILVIAPGQGCNSRRPLFEALGNHGAQLGYVVARFEWNYCNSSPTNPTPSSDLSAEVEDFKTVLNYAKGLANVDSHRVHLMGKSLGSMVGYKVFESDMNAKSLVLLTPVCSLSYDDSGQPLPSPLPVIEEYYPGLKNQTRPILMTGGSNDQLCHLPLLYRYLGESSGNITTVIVGGDHSLSIRTSAGAIDEIKTKANVDTAMHSALNWINQQ